MQTPIYLALAALAVILFLRPQAKHNYTDITASQALDLINSQPDLVIVDVREPGEFNAGHITGAINLPLNSGVLHQRYLELPADGPILIYCRSGHRSSNAAHWLEKAPRNFTHIYNMKGGFPRWKGPSTP